ncbi:hypothetical protein NQ314_004610 [Rhamnusium bicolor]|uniref:Alpha-soluble NSF attachment protein n=1 Tax=Rhamnusium bicolor TaxID=1586634 RepID=A0AAV8ZL88_9CUCU|nr:hypothetical protein NQ314_004610 [Rhamnusium bicolor]
MAHIELKAQQLREEAEKKMNSGGFFKTLFTKNSSRIEESIEYYTRAGNLFKMAKNWSQAGFAFADAADLNFRNDNYVEAAINFVEAANCFKRCDINKAIDYYLKAIAIYSEKGKFVMAAKYHQLIAELLEDESDIDEATVHYEKAADFFKQECNFSSANKCLEKIAEYAALSADYHKAITIFQEIACFDLAKADIRAKLQTYVNMHPAFEDSREYQLIVCLLECMEHGDSEGYTNAITKYDSVTKLNQWHVTMLLRVKKPNDRLS